MKRLKIALVVPGRFHAFDLGRELIALGHDVTVFTNYPARAAAAYGLDPSRVQSCVMHGLASRVLDRVPVGGLARRLEPARHQAFGRWAARALGTTAWDVVHIWSGIAEETLLRRPRVSGATLLLRGSAHVAEQSRLLQEEERRAGVVIDRPTPWMIAREQREYALADQVVVLSSFAESTFKAHGHPPRQLVVLPLGTRTEAFRPTEAMVEARVARVRSDGPLRVLYAGNVSFQKGVIDLLSVAQALAGERFRFRAVGAAMPEVQALLPELQRFVTLSGKIPERDLPGAYRDADVFLFPTIQDGFAAVLAQAQAAGLPIITTANSGGPDLVRNDDNGWIVPIRRPLALIERLRMCDSRREELASMCRRVYDTFRARDWSDVARHFERICADLTDSAPVERHG